MAARNQGMALGKDMREREFEASPCEGLFHVHSRFSSDGKLSLAELKTECLARGLHFMVVTDHAEDFGPGDLEDYVSECRGLSGRDFLAVPGLELRLPGNEEFHLLIAGWGYPPSGGYKPMAETLADELGCRNGALVVLAHPRKSGSRSGRPLPSLPGGIEPAIDGVEIWNASTDSRYLPDHRAIRTYMAIKSNRAGLVGIGGLDLHDRSGFRGVRLRIKGEFRDAGGLINRIRSGDFETRGTYLKVGSAPEYREITLALLSAGRLLLDAADSLATALKLRAGKTNR